MPLLHGGNLVEAEARYGIKRDEWLDLSTGVSPLSYGFDSFSARSWSRLPGDMEALHGAAWRYYGASALLSVPGSQWAIQTLPRLRRQGRVAVLAPSYQEHAFQWQRFGHVVDSFAAAELSVVGQACDVVILANPNNPDNYCFDRESLLSCLGQLRKRQGWLIVDEAFIDFSETESLVTAASKQDNTETGLIVLRSPGKPFGLAGARVGFVWAWPDLLARLKDELGPWPIAGPSMEIVTAALEDTSWQILTRQQLAKFSTRLKVLLEGAGLSVTALNTLFAYVQTEHAPAIYEAMAKEGILLRLFPAADRYPPALRLGLPGAEGDWQRLQESLGRVCRSILHET
ncbi:MAG: threonine-phosphate decarboxylase CobD [Candidatus Obscuribacter sp.]|nr:threonine-phosphate decarboxylase CobD [Candidatus Obscuribacter sp.]